MTDIEKLKEMADPHTKLVDAINLMRLENNEKLAEIIKAIDLMRTENNERNDSVINYKESQKNGDINFCKQSSLVSVIGDVIVLLSSYISI